MKKILALVAVASLVLVTLPTGAAAGKRCRAYKPALVSSQSGQHADAAKEKIIVVGDSATQEDPITVAYEHSVGLDLGASYDVIVADGRFFNLQIRSKKASPTLNMRSEWASPSPQDVELFLYDRSGSEVDSSASFNPFPPLNNDDDGDGFEQITGIFTRNCDGFTVESQGGITVAVQATLNIWLD